MKRKIIVKAVGVSTTAKVTIEVNAPSDYGRDDTNKLTLDLTDAIMDALKSKYRSSKIRVV